MRQIYRRKLNSDVKLDICVLNVQRQQNGSDCGVFAVANAFNWASLQDPSEVVYETENNAMRAHLAACLEACTLLPFPAQFEMS